MSRIIIFGDSNSYGAGLSDPINENFGYHLGKYFNKEVINLAVPGGSNTRIMYEILNFDFQSTDVVFIGWTYVFRDAVFLRKDKIEHYGSWIDPKVAKNKDWLRYAEEYDLTVKSYMHMHHANCYFETKNIKLVQVFLEEVPNAFYIKKDFKWSDKLEMSFDILKEVKYVDLTSCNHPGPKTHKLFAEYLCENFKDKFL